MSLKTVRQAFITRVETLLPTYNKLTNVLDIEDNSDRFLKKGFACVWGEGRPTTGPLKKVALEHSMRITLTNIVDQRASDNVAPDIDDVYDDIDTLIRSIFDATRLGIPSTIRGIRDVSVSAPLLISGKKYSQIDLFFTVNFTLTIN